VTEVPTVYGPGLEALTVGGEMVVAAAADVTGAQAAPAITTGMSIRVQRSNKHSRGR
jgi:RecJ-like exonuclease